MSELTLPADYGYVILAALGISFQLTLTGFSIGGQRKKHGIKYPDMGNGRYAAKLSDEAWVEFNNYQRAHYNYLENAPQILTYLATSGLFMPKTAAGLGLAYMVGRSFYSTNYSKKGADARYNGGGILIMIGQLGMLGIAAYGAVKSLGFF